MGGQGTGDLIFKNPLKKFPDFSNRKGKPFTKCAAKRRSDKASLILAQSRVTGPPVIELQITDTVSPAELRSQGLVIIILLPDPLITRRIRWE